jgi:hypothetical protein
MKKETSDQNQGEGDKVSARKYNNDLRDFISTGKVDKAANDARAYVESDPEGAARAERKAKHGTVRPIDEIVAMGRNLVERVKRGLAAFRETPKK